MKIGYESYLRQYRNSEMQKPCYIKQYWLRKNYKKLLWLMEERRWSTVKGKINSQ
jgi:hypothetical protein